MASDEPEVDAEAEQQKEETEERQTAVLVVVTGHGDAKVELRHVAGDTVELLRLALEDQRDTCHLTNYTLSIRSSSEEGGERVVMQDAVELGDYVELQGKPTAAVAKLHVQINVHNYDVKKAKDQLKRTRQVINFPSASFVDGGGAEDDENGDDDDGDFFAKLPSSEEIFKPANLSEFYQEALFRVAAVDTAVAPSATHLPSAHRLPLDCIKNVSLSGWNPPPPARRMAGDLLYIDATTVDSGILQITASPSGFYVNSSSRGSFDPSPSATRPCFSNTLLDCLLQASPAFAAAWSALAQPRRSGRSAHALDAVATAVAQGRPEASTAKQWCAVPQILISPQSSAIKAHTFDAFRSQQEDLYGLGDERGAAREWLGELRETRDLASSALKLRLQTKIVTDFVAAATAGAVGVIDGDIMPYHAVDPSAASDGSVTGENSLTMFSYNGIFYTSPSGVKEFRLGAGADAARKMAAHDVKNSRLVQSLGIDGLSAPLQAVIDYKGHRLVAQTTIPGVLNSGGAAQGTARLMYGTLGNGERISVKTPALELMETLASKLFLSKRALPASFSLPDRLLPPPLDDFAANNQQLLEEGAQQPSPLIIDTEGEVEAADSATVPFIGPVECKLIHGSDARSYLLELTRVTPRDANYVAERGTQKLSAEQLAAVDPDLAVAYVLRSELIFAFASRRLQKKKEAALGELRETLLAEAKTRAKAKAAAAAPSDGAAAAAATVAATADDAAAAAAAAAAESAMTAAENEALEELGKERHAEIVKALEAITPASLKLELNPNVFLAVPAGADAAAVTADEETAREISTYLMDKVLPGVVQGVREGQIVPLDNAHLVVQLHTAGINMRYLGQLARAARAEETSDVRHNRMNSMPVFDFPRYWRDLLEVELVARSVKHVFNALLGSSAAVRAAPAATIASLLSHVLSTATSASVDAAAAAKEDSSQPGQGDKKSKKNKKKASPTAAAAAAAAAAGSTGLGAIPSAPDAAVSREAVLAAVEKEMRARFLYSFDDLRIKLDAMNVAPSETLKAALTAAGEPIPEARDIPAEVEGEDVAGPLGSRLDRVRLLRRICLLLGLQVATRTYDTMQAAPVKPVDIVSLQPVTKSTEPESPVPELLDIISNVDAALKQHDLQTAFALSHQGLAFAESIFLSVHPDYVSCVETVASVYEAAGDLHSAFVYGNKALLLQAQLSGLDSHQTIISHKRIAKLLLSIGNFSLAVQHILTAKYLVSLCGGPSHPELCSLYELLAMAVQTRSHGTLSTTSTSTSTSPAPNALSDDEQAKADRARRNADGLAVRLVREAREMSSNLARTASLSKLLAEMQLEAGGPIDLAVDELDKAYRLFSSICGDDSVPAIEAKTALTSAKRKLTERNVQLAKAYKERVLAGRDEAAALAAAAAALQEQQQQQKQQKQQQQKRSNNYKDLFKNHARVRR